MDDELHEHYGKLLDFVRSTQAKPSCDGQALADFAKMQTVATTFAADWKTGIQAMNSKLMKYFSNFKTGISIMRAMMKELLVWYQSFLDVVKAQGKASQLSKILVSINTIKYEIKRNIELPDLE